MDHPRSCGVYSIVAVLESMRSGSSPLVRGLLRALAASRAADGIIPARAGFTSAAPGRAGSGWDHPRSCGVYTAASGRIFRPIGSSPLVRGLLFDEFIIEKGSRIIPARAGFTLADPWNPNELTLYQTPAAFTADLGPAPPGRDSAVEFGAALSAAGRAGRDLVAAGLRSRFGHHPDTHRRVATTSG